MEDKIKENVACERREMCAMFWSESIKKSNHSLCGSLEKNGALVNMLMSL